MPFALYIVAALLICAALGLLFVGEGSRAARSRALLGIVVAAAVLTPVYSALPELADRLRDRLLNPGEEESKLVVVATWGALAKQLALTFSVFVLGFTVLVVRRELLRIATGFAIAIAGAVLTSLAFAFDRWALAAAALEQAAAADDDELVAVASVSVLPWIVAGASVVLVLAYALLASKLLAREAESAAAAIDGASLSYGEPTR